MARSEHDNSKFHELTAYTDGAARGNPGPAAAAAVLLHADRVVAEKSKFLGTATNNRAEYEGVLLALEEARRLGARTLTIYTDSELIARQIRGSYRVKKPDLKPLHARAVGLSAGFDRFNIIEIPREKNRHADRLANEAIDGALGR